MPGGAHERDRERKSREHVRFHSSEIAWLRGTRPRTTEEVLTSRTWLVLLVSTFRERSVSKSA